MDSKDFYGKPPWYHGGWAEINESVQRFFANEPDPPDPSVIWEQARKQLKPIKPGPVPKVEPPTFGPSQLLAKARTLKVSGYDDNQVGLKKLMDELQQQMIESMKSRVTMEPPRQVIDIDYEVLQDPWYGQPGILRKPPDPPKDYLVEIPMREPPQHTLARLRADAAQLELEFNRAPVGSQQFYGCKNRLLLVYGHIKVILAYLHPE